jgi:hypothetical protein
MHVVGREGDGAVSKPPCTACGGKAPSLQPALVLAGPNDLRPGKVCPDCAALGWLLVMGPDAVDAPAAVEPSAKGGARKKRGEKHVPGPLPQSSRPQVMWGPGVAKQLEEMRGRAPAPVINNEGNDDDADDDLGSDVRGAQGSVSARPAVPHDKAGHRQKLIGRRKEGDENGEAGLQPEHRRHENRTDRDGRVTAHEGFDPMEEEQYQKWKALVAIGMRLVPSRVADAVLLGLSGDNLTHVGARFGFDRELDHDFRARITMRLRNPPGSGSEPIGMRGRT